MSVVKKMMVAVCVGLGLLSVQAQAEDVMLFKKYPIKGWYGSGWKGAKARFVADPAPARETRSIELGCTEKIQPFAGCTFRTKRDTSVITLPEGAMENGRLTFKVMLKEDIGQDVTMQLMTNLKGSKSKNKVLLSSVADLKAARDKWVDVSIPLSKFDSAMTDFTGIMFRFNRTPAPIFLSMVELKFGAEAAEAETE